MRSIECYSCGDEFAQIALHWTGEKCDRPEFSDEQLELMRGLLLGDADIMPGTNGSIFRIRMTNKQFLEWLDAELSPLSRGVFISETADEQKESAIRGNLEGVCGDSSFKDLYGLRTVTHPQIDELRNWYSSGNKRYPNEITEQMFRMWYVTDGWKKRNGVRIRCIDQSDQSQHVRNLIETLEFVDSASYDSNHGIIRLSASDSNRFWKRTEPPVGFSYKWP